MCLQHAGNTAATRASSADRVPPVFLPHLLAPVCRRPGLLASPLMPGSDGTPPMRSPQATGSFSRRLAVVVAYLDIVSTGYPISRRRSGRGVIASYGLTSRLPSVNFGRRRRFVAAAAAAAGLLRQGSARLRPGVVDRVVPKLCRFSCRRGFLFRRNPLRLHWLRNPVRLLPGALWGHGVRKLGLVG